VRFPEGPAVETVSHLATWLYAWAFQLPWGGFEDRLLLARHVELLAILFTMGGLPALARALAPSAAGRLRGAWVAFFLFPSIFVYDTAPLGAADHVAALWTVPVCLSLARFWRSWAARDGVLLGSMIGGLLLTKYPAVALVAPVGVILLGGAVRRATTGAGAWRPAARGLSACAATIVLVTTPHWLKNLVFYGSPLYPALCGRLRCDPWTPSSPAWVARYVSESVDVAGDRPVTVGNALRALVDFSYGAYTWPDFHGLTPAFGSLFTACLIVLPFLRGTRRLWLAVAGAHAAVLLWFVTAHQERYLVPLVPLLAAAVAATVSLAFRQGTRPARAAVVLLVAAQAVGAAAIPFLPTHRAHQQSPLGRGIAYLGLTTRAERAAHLGSFVDWQEIGAALPRDAVVLLHRNYLHLGIARRVVSDVVPHQFGLDYAALGSTEALHRRLRAWGVTHVAWADDQPDQDSLAGELLFRAYARLGGGAGPRATLHGWTIAPLPAEAPADPGSAVLDVSCADPARTGLYAWSDLSAPEPPVGRPRPRPAPRETALDARQLLERASYVVVDGPCLPAADLARLVPLGARQSDEGRQLLFVRAAGRGS